MFIFLYVGTSTTFSGSYGAHSCSSNNYFNNANYERNVNLAFSSLENNIKIHVIIQERKKKTALDFCQLCVKNETFTLPKFCPTSKETII